MKLKILFFSILFLNISGGLLAQSPADAVRYGTFNSPSTARSAGLGGSVGALGADFSAASSNPAGIGLYRSSEFVITPSLLNSEAEANLGNNALNTQTTTGFNLNNMHFVINKNRDKSRNDWTTSNIGIGLNRLTSHRENTNYSGTSSGSIAEYFRDLAQGINPSNLNPFGTQLAYDAGMIYPRSNTDTSNYITDFDGTPNELIEREETITRRGYTTEFAISYGTTYKDKLSIGATIGIPIVDYSEKHEYRERDRNNKIPAFENSQYNEYFSTTGTGVNLKIGAIFRATQMLRLGLAFHTPTFYGLQDSFYTNINYTYTDNGTTSTGQAFSPDDAAPYAYNLTTPWRTIGNIGLMFEGRGFITLETEYVNYAKSRFSYDSGDIQAQNSVNSAIKNIYGSAINFRLGGEYAYEVFRFRAGLSALQNAAKAGEGGFQTGYSLGVGIRGKGAFADFAYTTAPNTRTYQPYQSTDANRLQNVNINTQIQNFLFTVGFRF